MKNIVEMAHLQLAMGLSASEIRRLERIGEIPVHLHHAARKRRCWSLTDIRAWRPDVANFITPLLELHPVGARKAA